jgi:hypothetical protein
MTTTQNFKWIGISKGMILLANLLQSFSRTFPEESFLSFFAFKEGMLDTPIPVLGVGQQYRAFLRRHLMLNSGSETAGTASGGECVPPRVAARRQRHEADSEDSGDVSRRRLHTRPSWAAARGGACSRPAAGGRGPAARGGARAGQAPRLGGNTVHRRGIRGRGGLLLREHAAGAQAQLSPESHPVSRSVLRDDGKRHRPHDAGGVLQHALSSFVTARSCNGFGCARDLSVG